MHAHSICFQKTLLPALVAYVYYYDIRNLRVHVIEPFVNFTRLVSGLQSLRKPSYCQEFVGRELEEKRCS